MMEGLMVIFDLLVLCFAIIGFCLVIAGFIIHINEREPEDGWHLLKKETTVRKHGKYKIKVKHKDYVIFKLVINGYHVAGKSHGSVESVQQEISDYIERKEILGAEREARKFEAEHTNFAEMVEDLPKEEHK